ncbi:MAG TPA: biopolymer transporter ExbD [Polyangiaceae bacterium]|nr:biopolymer transporter ExbD [Polyangiaceae bacterium]
MAIQTRSNEQGMFSGINVTPLVDIMLVLLVIFMVTARLIVSQTVPMDLPKAASGGEQQVVFAVAVSAKGETTIDSRPVNSDKELESLARAAKEKTSDLRAVIHADTNVSHGKVIRVMDLLKRSGISKIAFGVSPEALETNRQ